MVAAYRYFMEVSLTDDAPPSPRNWGDEWLVCVQAYIEFQRRASFPDAGSSFPPAKGVRPPEIAVWMKNRRPWKDVEIKDTGIFSRQWWAWWLSLQPKSRICGSGADDNLLPTLEMDWSQLQKPGKNGFLLMMLALVWWGQAVDRDPGG